MSARQTPQRSRPVRSRAGQVIGDVSGAFADLGAFLPLVIGVLLIGSYDASGLLAGFGVFAIATGLIYRRPVPVQPMKAIAALAITGGMSAAAVSASGFIIGAALLIFAAAGLIEYLRRAVPRTILFGVQLGLGVSLIVTSAGLAGDAIWAGLAVLGFLAVLQRTGLQMAGGLIVLSCGVTWAAVTDSAALPQLAAGWHPPTLQLPSLSAFVEALETGVLPQLALTITNAVLLTAAIAADYFPKDAGRISPRNLALSTGGLNVLLAPFGAMPMCHGAGGLAAQYGQGARTGLAPVIFGAACLALGLFAAPNALAWLSLTPAPVIAALLAFAGFQLMSIRRLAMLRPACLAIIGLTALTCVFVNVAAGLAAGVAAELIRSRLLRGFAALQPSRNP